MKTAHHLGPLLACALGACATAGGPSAAPQKPPRLAMAPQEPPGVVGVQSLCGLTVVGNEGGLHFRMELSGDKVGVHPGGPGEAKEVFVVDGLRVQVTSIAGNQISPAARDLAGIDLLRMHSRFESARVSEATGREVKPEEIEILASHEMPSGLLWWFSSGQADEEGPAPGGDSASGEPSDGRDGGPEAPAPAATAAPNRPTGIAYMTAAYGNRVLVLSVQGLRGESKSALLAKAKAWMATVATSSRAISATQVRADIKAALAAGQTCPGRPNAIFEEEPAAAPAQK